MIYYGTKLSDNISRREPEGYLLCLNVPVARTGFQDYLPEELGIPRSRAEPGGMVKVFRPEEEVFSPETIASFEGMPVTNDHPPDGVTIENVKALSKGNVHNVRRGSGEESDLLLADLIIQDKKLIDLIMNDGKREISCGYMYELSEEDGQYVQRNIRGNHVAVVDAGRAGPRVSIKDEQPRCSILERSPIRMKEALYKKLVRMARDGDADAIEAVAEIVEALTEPDTVVVVPEETAATAPAEPAAAVAAVIPEEPALDEEPTLAMVLEKLDQILSALKPAAAGDELPPAGKEGDPVEEIVEAVAQAMETGAAAVEEAIDPAVAEVSEIVEEVLAEQEPSTVIEQNEQDECGEKENADALRAAISAVRPALAKLPKAQRDKIAGDIATRLKKAPAAKASGAGVYAALAAAKAHDNASNDRDLGKQIMASRNPHYKQD